MSSKLEFIFVYIYLVLLFTFFFDHYQNDDLQYSESENGDNLCYSLLHCCVSILNFGLRAGGGIGDALPSNTYFNDSKEGYYMRAWNNLSSR